MTSRRGGIMKEGRESAVAPSPMKMKLSAVLLVVAGAVRLMAAEPSGVLLKANSVMVEGQRMIATDQASLITQGSDVKVTADKIIYDRSTSTFTLSGHVRIQSGGTTLETSEATMDAAGKRVVHLTSGQITFSSDASGVPAEAGAPASMLPTFSEPMPKLETKLSK